MTNEKTLFDFDPDAQPTSEKTITICHVDEDHDVYGGRHSYGRCMGETAPGQNGWLGNPYTVADHGREECIAMFKTRFNSELRQNHEFCLAVTALTGQRVACHCRHSDEDEPACHLDVVREALLDGRVYRIAHDLHDITLTDAERDQMADPEEVL